MGKHLGEGTFGSVCLASRRSDGLQVAVKKIFPPKNKFEGVSFSALREIRFMRELQHENLVTLLDVFVSDEERRVCLVLELLATDLQAILYTGQPRVQLRPPDIKSITRMMLEGLSFLHSRWVLHRDLKPGNVFVSSSGVVKLADFGLARSFGSPNQPMSPGAVTQWYRSPELLFGACQYGGAVDVWSVACIFAELWLRRPLFQAEMPNDIDQLGKIFMLLGTPNSHEWPGVDELCNFVEFAAAAPVSFDKFLPPFATEADIEFLRPLLQLDPNRRATAQEALESPYFTQQPLPTPPRLLPR